MSTIDAGVPSAGTDRLLLNLTGSAEGQAVDHQIVALWNEGFVVAAKDPVVGAAIRELTREWIDRLLKIVEEARAAGELRRGLDPRETVMNLIALSLGFDTLTAMEAVSRQYARSAIETFIEAELLAA